MTSVRPKKPRRESNAALARVNRSGSTPKGDEGGAMGVAAAGGVRNTRAGNVLGLAADDSMTLPAPAAPKRNISLRCKDIHPSRKEAEVVSAGRLIADNQNQVYPRPVP